MKRKLLIWNVVIIIMLTMFPACTSGSSSPEAALWGEWEHESGKSSIQSFAYSLTFFEDGRLVMNRQENDPAQYVVIAPGRIKITINDESEVYDFQMSEGVLSFYLDDEIQQFTKINEVETVTLCVEENPGAEPGADSSTPIPATLTPTQPAPTNTIEVPTATQTKTATLSEPTMTATSSLDDKYLGYQINEIDSMPMVFVPEGEFIMGSNEDEDPYFWGAEGPAHEVYLESFWIYQTEVTNAMYQACVADQACPKPLRNESRTVEDYYLNERFASYPVIQVNWVDAVSYCVWAGGRLPTEAEWEKAARGTDGRYFPWGNSGLTPELASFCGSNCSGQEREQIDDDYYEIAPVGMFPAGASPYGALDMAGNVWEWVFDYFQSLYYQSSPYENPLGPATGSRRVIRGGSWFNPLDGLRTVARTSLPPNDGLDTVGFRCVVDADQ